MDTSACPYFGQESITVCRAWPPKAPPMNRTFEFLKIRRLNKRSSELQGLGFNWVFWTFTEARELGVPNSQSLSGTCSKEGRITKLVEWQNTICVAMQRLGKPAKSHNIRMLDKVQHTLGMGATNMPGWRMEHWLHKFVFLCSALLGGCLPQNRHLLGAPKIMKNHFSKTFKPDGKIPSAAPHWLAVWLTCRLWNNCHEIL